MPRRSNKFGDLMRLFTPLNIVLLIVAVAIVVFIVSVMGSFSPSKLPKMVPGWNHDLFFNHLLKDTYSTDPDKKYTLEQCQQLASSTPGVKYFTHRTADHPDPAFQNTCILYSTPSDYVVNIDVTNGDTSLPDDTYTGCVDPSKTWPNCN